jgi:hypothetical protein
MLTGWRGVLWSAEGWKTFRGRAYRGSTSSSKVCVVPWWVLDGARLLGEGAERAAQLLLLHAVMACRGPPLVAHPRMTLV